MNSKINQSRRSLLKLGGAAIALVPVAAFAAKNENIRKAMKCSGCIHFVPGKTPTDLGGCKIFGGDTEIHPNGYCTAWAKKP